MAVTVSDLLPGDQVTNGIMSAVFITRTKHPVHPGLVLVVWRLDDGTISPDALLARQEVGELTPATPGERYDRLMEALR